MLITQLVHTGNVNNIQELIRKGEETLSKANTYFNANGLFFLFISEETAQGQTKRENKKARYSLLLTAKEWSKGRSISVAEVS